VSTPLTRPVTREVLLDGEPFKVTISPDGVAIRRKGRRKGSVVTWENVLSLGQTQDVPRGIVQPNETNVPTAIARGVAAEIQSAKAALKRAGEKLSEIGDVPPILLSEMEPDPVYGRAEQRSDWFIEPLLTAAEVASVLRISTVAVARLRIRWISIAGERRYRQSEVRQYITREERVGVESRW
jgi:hypothetical protein